jgi:hypothetical protein
VTVFARVTVFAVKPAVWPGLIAAARDRAMAASQSHEGFLRAELLTRSRLNKAIYTSFWRTEYDAMQAEEQGLLDDEMALFEPYAAGPGVVEGYEVSALVDVSSSPGAGTEPETRSTTMSQ